MIQQADRTTCVHTSILFRCPMFFFFACADLEQYSGTFQCDNKSFQTRSPIQYGLLFSFQASLNMRCFWLNNKTYNNMFKRHYIYQIFSSSFHLYWLLNENTIICIILQTLIFSRTWGKSYMCIYFQIWSSCFDKCKKNWDKWRE